MSPTSSLPTPAVDPNGRAGRGLLIALALLTLVATIDKAAGLSAPPPTLAAPAKVHLPGYRVQTLPSESPQRGRELSRGTLRRFRLTPRSGMPELTVTLLPVRSRTATDLSAETMGGKGLSLATVAAVVPGFLLQDKRVVSLPIAPAEGSAPSGDQVILGRAQGDPAGRTTRLQTCLTASGLAAVQATSLAGQGELPRDPAVTSGPRGRLLRVAGLSQTRHACLAVQIALQPSSGQSGSGTVEREGGENQARLEAAWRELRSALRQG